MKNNLLSLLKCPKCSESKFIVISNIKKNQEIRKGKVICNNCKTSFNIKEGILDLIFNPSEELVKEQKENLNVFNNKRSKKNDDWLLSLPLANDFGNEKHPIINKGFLANIQLLIKSLDDMKNKKILDIGAGTCWTTNMFAEKKAYCVAIDISSKKYIGLSSADTFFKYNKTYFERVLSDMNKLPFRDKSFDIVFSNASVHHAQDIYRVFQEASKVLKTKGLLVLSNEPCCSIFKLNRQINIAKSKERGMDVSEEWNEMIYSLYQYKRYLRKAGFKSNILYPALYNIILNDKKNLNSIYGIKHNLAKTFFFLYQANMIRKLFKSLFLLYLLLFGGPIVAIAQKKLKHL